MLHIATDSCTLSSVNTVICGRLAEGCCGIQSPSWIKLQAHTPPRARKEVRPSRSGQVSTGPARANSGLFQSVTDGSHSVHLASVGRSGWGSCASFSAPQPQLGGLVSIHYSVKPNQCLCVINPSTQHRKGCGTPQHMVGPRDCTAGWGKSGQSACPCAEDFLEHPCDWPEPEGLQTSGRVKDSSSRLGSSPRCSTGRPLQPPSTDSQEHQPLHGAIPVKLG